MMGYDYIAEYLEQNRTDLKSIGQQEYELKDLRDKKKREAKDNVGYIRAKLYSVIKDEDITSDTKIYLSAVNNNLPSMETKFADENEFKKLWQKERNPSNGHYNDGTKLSEWSIESIYNTIHNTYQQIN